jgi:hypothetical protein
MSQDLFGNPVVEVVVDEAAEIRREVADARAFWNRMAFTPGNDSTIALKAKEGYFNMKKEAGL